MNRTARRSACLLAVTATAALPAATSATVAEPAEIQPQRSILGVRLGMSEEQVRARLGEPSRTIRDSNDFGPYIELVYRRERLRVRLQGEEQVTWISTTNRRHDTSFRGGPGVGPGSHERSVRRQLRNERCQTFMRFRYCVIGRELPGRRVTTFHINRRQRVTRVTLGIVID